MIKNRFMQKMIQDLIQAEQYTLEGIAYYTDTDVKIVKNIYHCHATSAPSDFLYRLIELHYLLCKDFYMDILKKITFS